MTRTDGLHLTRDGRWLHDGTPVEHAGLSALLSRSVARAPDGSLVVTTGIDALAFTSDDAPLVVRTVEHGALVLSNEVREPCGSRDILIDDDGNMHTSVCGGRFWAVLSRSAAQWVMAHIDGDGVLPGGARLRPGPVYDWRRPP